MTPRMPALLAMMMCACSTPPSPTPQSRPFIALQQLSAQIRSETPPACLQPPRDPQAMTAGRDWREAAGAYRADAVFNAALLRACQAQLEQGAPLTPAAPPPAQPDQP